MYTTNPDILSLPSGTSVLPPNGQALDLTPSGRHKDKRRIQQKGRKGKMSKKNKERRVYATEFKAEAIAQAEKHEKPLVRVIFVQGEPR
jgi:hypothetical protein